MSKVQKQPSGPSAANTTTKTIITSKRRARAKPKSQPHPYAEQIAIAARYRHLVPRGRSVLFFGTKHARTIIRDDRLRSFRLRGGPMISLTRSLHVAVQIAMLSRDNEEATGAIMMLDRDLLRTRYKLVSHRDHTFADSFSEYRQPSGKEAEEIIEVGAIIDLKRYLLGVIWLQEDEAYPAIRSRKTKSSELLNAAIRARNGLTCDVFPELREISRLAGDVPDEETWLALA
jgi:hypothetical protein